LLEHRHDALPFHSAARPGSDERRPHTSTLGDAQRATLGDAQRATLGDAQRATLGNTQRTTLGNAQRGTLGNAQPTTLGDAQRSTLGDAGPKCDAHADSVAFPLTGSLRDADAGGGSAPVRFDRLAGRGLSARDGRELR
jgi:hypothetical protein